jgi:hypothetical protein
LSTSAERLEHAIVDATRLAFASSSFPQLPAWVRQEQVGKALGDGIVTDAELVTLVSADTWLSASP